MKKVKMDETITIRVSFEEKERLMNEAISNDCSLSSWARVKLLKLPLSTINSICFKKDNGDYIFYSKNSK